MCLPKNRADPIDSRFPLMLLAGPLWQILLHKKMSAKGTNCRCAEATHHFFQFITKFDFMSVHRYCKIFSREKIIHTKKCSTLLCLYTEMKKVNKSTLGFIYHLYLYETCNGFFMMKNRLYCFSSHLSKIKVII